jgi:molecular chaperone GrpE
MKKQDGDIKQIDELKLQVDMWKSKYLRALADYQNLEKRSREQLIEGRVFAAEQIIVRILSVVDTFSKVKEHIHDVGFDLAYKELLAVLSEQGAERMVVVGKPFNPHEMECIEVVDLPAGEAGGEENTVIEESLPGYLFHGKIIRVAQVKVGKQLHTSANDKSTHESTYDDNQIR